MGHSGVQNLIESFLKNLGVSYSRIDVAHENAHTMFVVRTNESGLLIGQNGENLRALNTVVRRMAERKFGEAAAGGFMLDINGYYTRKVREIKQQAKVLADRARLFKSEVEMSPMNSYERMIVHALFADDPEIATESRGEGRLRHVVIRYKNTEKSLLTSDTSLLAN